MYKKGDLVIYRKNKISSSPGPRAEEISPSAHGENYTYVVDKYWIVAEVLPHEDSLLVKTRTNKAHVLPMDDPNLRKANLWNRITCRDRFPKQPR